MTVSESVLLSMIQEVDDIAGDICRIQGAVLDGDLDRVEGMAHDINNRLLKLRLWLESVIRDNEPGGDDVAV